MHAVYSKSRKAVTGAHVVFPGYETSPPGAEGRWVKERMHGKKTWRTNSLACGLLRPHGASLFVPWHRTPNLMRNLQSVFIHCLRSCRKFWLSRGVYLTFETFETKQVYSLHILLKCDSTQSTSSIFKIKGDFPLPVHLLLKQRCFFCGFPYLELGAMEGSGGGRQRPLSVFSVLGDLTMNALSQEHGSLWESVASLSFPS